MKILISQFVHFIPLAKYLSSKGHNILTLDSNFYKALINVDVTASYVGSSLNNELVFQSFRNAAEVIIHASKPFSADGITAKPLEYMQTSINGFLYSRLSDIISIVKLLDIEKPELIILHNDVEPLMMTIALWAKERCIPCLHVPHAVTLDVDKGQIGSDIHDFCIAPYICASGQYQKEWFEKRNINTIKITGLPSFDKMATFSMSKARASKSLNLSPTKPIVTYASSWRQDTNLLGCHDGVEETYQAVLGVFKGLDFAQLIVKIHPSAGQANLQWHITQANLAGVRCIVTPHHLETILSATDILLAYGPSNILLDGSFFPNVRLMTTHGYEFEDESIIFVGEEVDSIKIKNEITGALSSLPKNQMKFNEKYCGGFVDGLNYMRVGEYALSLV